MSISSSVSRLSFSRLPVLTNADNHINGENLMEMDQTHLKDMGIKKVGDRVRIGSQAKQLRNKEYKKASRRTSNRVSRLPTLVLSNLTPTAIARSTGQRRLHPTNVELAAPPALCPLYTRQLAHGKTHVPTNHKL
jgi:hypothetical protein